MKVGKISKTNKKGQIVIPKKIREELDIDSSTPLNLVVRGKGVYLYPVEKVITSADEESSYFDVLKETQGKYGKDDWKDLRKKRKKTEIKASEKRKKTW